MLTVIQEIWKAQHYLKFDSLEFFIPHTYYIEGENVQEFFFSKKNRKILKKKKENTSLKNLNSDVIMYRITTTTQADIIYLNHQQYVNWLNDYQKYPNLYQRIIIQEQISTKTYITYHYYQYIEQIHQNNNLNFDEAQEQQVNLYTKETISNAGQQIYQFLSLIDSVNQLKIIFKYHNQSIYLLLVKMIKTNKKSNSINFQLSHQYFYNQNIEIAQQQQHSQKQKKNKICASCKKLSSDSNQVLENKLWQIRMKRNLHKQNEQFLTLNKTGQIKPIKTSYDFVEICNDCYQAFLSLINCNLKPRPKSVKVQNIKNYETARKSQSIEQVKIKEPKLNLNTESHQEQQKISLIDDFDNLLIQIQNQ